MLRRYALADARVRILRHERNRGVSAPATPALRPPLASTWPLWTATTPLLLIFASACLRRRGGRGPTLPRAITRTWGIPGSITASTPKFARTRIIFYIQFCSAIYRSAFLREHGLRFFRAAACLGRSGFRFQRRPAGRAHGP